MEKKNKLLVTGSVAYDTIETPMDSEEFILGGSASYAALAASFFCPVMIEGVVGSDFKESDISRLRERGIDTEGLRVDPQGKTMFWRGKYHDNFNSRETLDIYAPLAGRLWPTGRMPVRSWASMMPFLQVTTRPCTRFSSSRTLPGQS